MWTDSFWRAAGERAIRTVAQTAAALLGTDAVNIIDVDWAGIAGVSVTAGVLSILTSIAASEVGAPGPSFGAEEELPTARGSRGK
jgi:hypothetical protein